MSLHLTIIQQFHDHLNAGRADDVLTLVTGDVTVGGPRGTTHGKQVVHDWIARANITMEPLHSIVRDHCVIVEQRATWQTDDGPSTQSVATLFTFEGDAISGIFRYSDPAEALSSLESDASETVGGLDHVK